MLAPDDRSICLSSSCMEPRWKDDRNAVKPQTLPQTSRSEESRDPYAGSCLTMPHNASRCLKGLVPGCAWFCLVGTANAWSEAVFQCTFYVFLPHKGLFLNFSDEAMIARGSTTDTVDQRTAAVGRIWAAFCVAGLLDLLDSFSMTWLQLAHAPLISSYTYNLLSFHMSPFCAQERNEIPMHTLQAVESVRLWDQRWMEQDRKFED